MKKYRKGMFLINPRRDELSSLVYHGLATSSFRLIFPKPSELLTPGSELISPCGKKVKKGFSRDNISVALGYSWFLEKYIKV